MESVIREGECSRAELVATSSTAPAKGITLACVLGERLRPAAVVSPFLIPLLRHHEVLPPRDVHGLHLPSRRRFSAICTAQGVSLPVQS